MDTGTLCVITEMNNVRGIFMDVGDWVTSYSKGYFRIERIIKRYYDVSHSGGFLGSNHIGEEIEDPIVVLKKGFNTNLKASLGFDSCALSLCKRISGDAHNIIEKKFIEDKKFEKRFNDYIIPPIVSLHNIGFNANRELLNIENIRDQIINGMTFAEIQEKLNTDFNFEFPHNKTIQFKNYDFEINESRELIFREVSIF
ncbi:hypothetical protein [Cohnella sp. AR92]|uniref:hypothetical protein n=1 Tax=Cohnella sp. AR92 TaxID=648716 RepID=UPI000F8F6636|nr:hypothetical protein [Cohnella sp. AR92]RUS41953.1 hypothetical protein ELR57_27585 [Cohnella sp. AR92]